MSVNNLSLNRQQFNLQLVTAPPHPVTKQHKCLRHVRISDGTGCMMSPILFSDAERSIRDV